MSRSFVFRSLRALAFLLPVLSSAGESRAEEAQPHAVVVGSSSVRGSLGKLIEADLERKGYRVDRLGIVGAGLARPDFRDMQAEAKKLPVDGNTAVVFVYLGVNDGQTIWLEPEERQRPGDRWLRWNDPRWSVVYRRRAQRFLDTLCQRGARQVIVMLPVEVLRPRLERRLHRIRALQQQAAERTSCASALATTRDESEPMVDASTRRPDGIHLTPLGADLVWQRVKRRAAAMLPSVGKWAH
ncbi:MAG: hypothetical protein DIU78_018735 [Pseudomonadota bacterium]